jgi:hypothetical protein
MKKFIIAGAALASLIVPAAASASFSSEVAASNKVEQSLQRRYPAYTVYAFCDQQGRGKYWCSLGGSRRDCLVTGHAWVRNGRVQLVGVNRNCF